MGAQTPSPFAASVLGGTNFEAFDRTPSLTGALQRSDGAAPRPRQQASGADNQRQGNNVVDSLLGAQTPSPFVDSSIGGASLVALDRTPSLPGALQRSNGAAARPLQQASGTEVELRGNNVVESLRRGRLRRAPKAGGRTSTLFESCNATCWASLKARLVETRASILMAQEIKIPKRQLQAAESWAAEHGWRAALAPCLVTAKGRHSAGVGVFVKRAISLAPVLHGSWILCNGRAAMAHVAAGPKGGIVAISLYLQDSLGPTGDNWDVLIKVAEILNRLRVPWIVGADWNMTPASLKESGWVTLVNGVIQAVADSIGTCRSTVGCYANLDYFVISAAAASAFSGTEAIRDAAVKTHRPVQVSLCAAPRSHMTTQLKRIRQFPRQPPPRPPSGAEAVAPFCLAIATVAQRARSFQRGGPGHGGRTRHFCCH